MVAPRIVWSDLGDGLRSDKVTVRKKSADEVRASLEGGGRPGLLSALRQSDDVCRHLWASTLRYLRLESAKLEADLKKKPQASRLPVGIVRGLVLLVIRKITQYRVAVPPELMVRPMTEILAEDWGWFTRQHFAECAVSVLAHLLPQTHYHRKIGPRSWQTLLSTTFQLFVSTPGDLRLLTACQFLYTVIRYSHQQSGVCQPFLLQKLDTWTQLLLASNLRQESSDTVNAFFRTLNLVMDILGLDHRDRLCQLGEETVTQVLDMFETRTSGVILEYFTRQLRLRHPGGAFTPEEGAYLPGGGENWHNHLFRIYANIIDTSIQNHLRRIRSRFERLWHLDDQLVELSSLVCHQLFVLSKANPVSMEVTQITRLDTTQCEPAAKKRRKMERVTLEDHLDYIQKCMTDRDQQKNTIPYLQVLYALLKQFPQSFVHPETDHWPKVFKAISESLKSCKLMEAKSLLLDCAFCLISTRDQFVSADGLDLSQTWEAVMTCLATNQCVESSHHLTRVMITRGLAKKVGSLFELFMRRVIRCNVHALKTLITLLRHREIPPNIATTESMRTLSASEGLFLWLFDEEVDAEDSVRFSDWETVYSQHPKLVANLMWTILLKSKSKVSLSITLEPRATTHTEVERALMTFAQLIPLKEQSGDSSQDRDRGSNEMAPVFSDEIKSLFLRMEELFLTNTRDSLEEIRTDDASSPSLMKAFNLCILMTHFVSDWPSLQDSALSRLVKHLQSLFDTCVSSFDHSVNSMTLDLAHKHFACLTRLLKACSDLNRPQFDPKGLQSLLQTLFRRFQNHENYCESKDMEAANSDGEDEPETEVTKHTRPVDLELLTLLIELAWFPSDQVQVDKNVEQLITTITTFSSVDLDAEKSQATLALIQKMIPKFSSSYHLLDEVLKVAQNVAKYALKSSKGTPDLSTFDPATTAALMQTLRALVIPLTKGGLDGANTRFQNITKVLLTIQKASGFLLFPPGVEFAFVELLLSISKQHILSWKCLRMKGSDLNNAGNYCPAFLEFDADQDHFVGYVFFRYFLHPLAQVRLMSLHGLHILFQNSGKTIQKKQEDLQTLKKVIDHLMSKEDESKSSLLLFASCLLAYSCVALAEPALDREVVVGIIALKVSHKIPSRDTKLTVENLAKAKVQGEISTKQYLTPMLTFVFNEFLKLFGTFKKFPTFLLDCTSIREMICEFESQCVPIYLWRHPNEKDFAILQDLDKTLKAVMVDNFARIAAFALPAASLGKANHGRVDAKARTKAKLIIDKSSNVLKQETFNELLNRFIPEILSMVFKSVHDSEALQTRFGLEFVLCQPNPPYTSEFLALNLIPFFDQLAESNGKLLSFLVELVPDTLQRMVSEITVDLKDPTVYVHSKIRALHGLYLFLVTVEKENVELKDHIPYIMWFISNTLRDLLQDRPTKELSFLVLHVVSKLLDINSYLESNLGGQRLWILPLRHALVSQLSDKGGFWREKAIELLRSMLLCASTRQELAKMGPFCPTIEGIGPMNEILLADGMAKRSLSDSIDNFLEVIDEDSVHLVQSLEHLHLKLRSLSDEKLALVKVLENSMGFTEDASRSPLHQLISALMKILASVCPKANSALFKAASRCLGEIGPIDLQTYALETRPCAKTDFSDLFSTYIMPLVQGAMKFVTNPCLHVSSAAVKALKALLRTPQADHLNQSNLGPYHALLVPFKISEGSQDDFEFDVDHRALLQMMGNDSLWSEGSCHSSWIRKLVCSFLECLSSRSTYRALGELCSTQDVFAQICFPILVHEILHRGLDSPSRLEVSERIAGFFNEFSKWNCDNKAASKPQGEAFKSFQDRSSIMTVLDLVNHLRAQKLAPTEKYCTWERHFWLRSLDYLKLAEAALHCSAYFSAILFCDVWCQDLRRRDSLLHEKASAYENDSLLDMMASKLPDKVRLCKEILFESHKSLGEKDALYGCNDIDSIQGQVQMMIQEQNYFKAIGILDSNAQDLNLTPDLAVIMLQSGLFTVLLAYIRSQPNPNAQLRDIQYECLSRLQDWGPVDVEGYDTHGSNESFHLHHFNALSSLDSEVEDRFLQEIALARESVTSRFSLSNRESSSSVYQDIARLTALAELEDIRSGKMSLKEVTSPRNFEAISFPLKEPILLQRCLALEKPPRHFSDEVSLDNILQVSQKYISECIQEEFFQLSLDRLRTLERLVPVEQKSVHHQLTFMKASNFWMANEKKMAIAILENLISLVEKKPRESIGLLSESLLTLGKWYSHEKVQSHSTVDGLFQKALDLYGHCQDFDKEKKSEAFIAMAKFSDEQYQKRQEYVLSKEFENKQAQRIRVAESVKDLGGVQGAKGNQDVTKSRIIFDRSAKNDEIEDHSILKERNRYLETAVMNYASALSISSRDQATAMFRFISLWFNNASNERVNMIVKKFISTLPTFKLIPLMYQLAARLSATESPFQTLLVALLVRCVTDHPFHAVPVFLALRNATKDEDNAANASQTDKDKIKISGDILEKAMKACNQNEGQRLRLVIERTHHLSLALIQFAYYAGKSPPSRDLLVHKLPDLSQIPILTLNMPVREDRNYSRDFVGIFRQETAFSRPGGITAPKKLSCVGTDGIKRTQLLKGKDDLRQDSVMQQVFSYLNQLLKTNSGTRKKRLRMRQYRVVPLSQRSGILEWCENTLPLRDYLIQAHKRYYPKDKKIEVIRNEIKKLADAKASVAKRKAAFLELSQAYHPVFRYFFYENFPAPSVHFERRLAYTRSMATASMIGYILGLGDRHLQNILIDCTTAEVIHIDFGVAFEQGKILPTPEKVPFRLTRDLVDGFGPSGVDGTFKRSCEETLKVLRENKEGIMTILEVLIHDPLYQWSLTPERVFRIYGENVDRGRTSQGDMAHKAMGERNQMAEMALSRVRQKLNGLEEGNYLSISGQVNGLIQQARDAENLSVIYCGWGAVL